MNWKINNYYCTRSAGLVKIISIKAATMVVVHEQSGKHIKYDTEGIIYSGRYLPGYTIKEHYSKEDYPEYYL